MDGYTLFCTAFVQAMTDHPHWRRGQALFNTLNEVHPDLAEALRCSTANPFYDDERAPHAMAWIAENWPQETSSTTSGYTYTTLYEAAHWGYNWTVVQVYRRSDGAYAVAHGGGCSCDSWDPDQEQTGAEYTFEVAEVYRRFRAALSERPYDFNAAQAFEHEDALRLALR